jgi:hypothetical protein
MIFKAFFLIVASFPRFDSHTSCTQFYLAACSFFTAARSPMSLHCFKCIIPYYALPTFNTLLLQPDSLPTSLQLFFFFFFFLTERTRDKEFSSFAVTSNFTIHDGLELELDKMMTSFVGRRRFAPTPTPCSYTRFILCDRPLACLLAASRASFR